MVQKLDEAMGVVTKKEKKPKKVLPSLARDVCVSILLCRSAARNAIFVLHSMARPG